MDDITREGIAKALEWLGKARIAVNYADAVSADLTEKALNYIDGLERHIVQVTPSDSEDASEAGGTETDTTTRQYRLKYIRETLERMLGYAGVWEDKNWTDGVTDSQLEAVFDQLRLMRERQAKK